MRSAFGFNPGDFWAETFLPGREVVPRHEARKRSNDLVAKAFA
jgi:hypothetical protein